MYDELLMIYGMKLGKFDWEQKGASQAE